MLAAELREFLHNLYLMTFVAELSWMFKKGFKSNRVNNEAPSK